MGLAFGFLVAGCDASPSEPAAPVERPPVQAPPTETPAQKTRREASVQLRQRGTRALARREWDRALAHFQNCIRAAPDCECYRGLGVVQVQRGRHAEGAQAYSKYLELCPHALDQDTVRELIERLEAKAKPASPAE